MTSALSDQKKVSTKETLMERISAIVDELIQEEETGAFKEDIDKDEFIAYTATLIGDGGVSAEMLASLSHEELKKRVESVMWAETAAGCLNDLSPEQIKAFDEALKDMRRL